MARKLVKIGENKWREMEVDDGPEGMTEILEMLNSLHEACAYHGITVLVERLIESDGSSVPLTPYNYVLKHRG